MNAHQFEITNLRDRLQLLAQRMMLEPEHSSATAHVINAAAELSEGLTFFRAPGATPKPAVEVGSRPVCPKCGHQIFGVIAECQVCKPMAVSTGTARWDRREVGV